MRNLFIFLAAIICIFVTHVQCVQDDTARQPLRIGIIGGGIGGSYTAYSIRQWLKQHTSIDDDEVSIDIIESRHRLGGRINHILVDGLMFEEGASIMHGSNQYMRNLTTSLGLSFREPKSENTFGLYDHNHHHFSFESSDWPLFDAAKLLWAHGIGLLSMRSATQHAAKLFHQLYAIQQNGTAFNTVEDMLKSVGLYEMTQITLEDHLLSVGAGPDLIASLVTGIVHVNYNQGPSSISALAGYVGSIPTVDSDLFAVKDGNRQLVEGAAVESQSSIKLAHSVSSIRHEANAKFVVRGTNHATSHPGRSFELQYDIVILASPLELSNISVELMEPVPVRQYQPTVATFVVGTLNSSAFGSEKSAPGMILTAGCQTHEEASGAADACPFSSLASHHRNESSGEQKYKIFSVKPLNESYLNSTFNQIRSFQSTEWRAYPRFSSPEHFAPFKLQLQDGSHVYYVSAFENAVSCIECMSIAAVNVANLVRSEIEEWFKAKHPIAGHFKIPEQSQFDYAKHSEL